MAFRNPRPFHLSAPPSSPNIPSQCDFTVQDCFCNSVIIVSHFIRKSESESCSVMSNSLWPHGLYSPWNSPGQNTGVGSLSLLQGIFPTQRLKPVSHIVGRFFTSWATREAQEYWSGQPIPSPVDLPDPGIEPGSLVWLHCRQILYQLSYQNTIYIRIQ